MRRAPGPPIKKRNHHNANTNNHNTNTSRPSRFIDSLVNAPLICVNESNKRCALDLDLDLDLLHGPNPTDYPRTSASVGA